MANTIGSGANADLFRTRWSNRQLRGGGHGWMMAQVTRLTSSRTGSEIMRNQVLLDLGLPVDRMPEAEVALRLAEFILSLPASGAMASVAIDGASIKVGDGVIFDIGRFMAATGWEPVKEPQVGRNAWTGAYRRGDKTIRVHSRPGEGDVVARSTAAASSQNARRDRWSESRDARSIRCSRRRSARRCCSRSPLTTSWSPPCRTRLSSVSSRRLGGADRWSDGPASGSPSWRATAQSPASTCSSTGRGAQWRRLF